MSTAPVELEWNVAEGGYEWSERDPHGGDLAHGRLLSDPEIQSYSDGRQWRLVARGWKSDPRFKGGKYLCAEKTYRPLTDESGLFQEFARLEPEREAILKFANRYGRLWGQVLNWGEPLWAWEGNIALMRFHITIWEAVKLNDEQSLKRLFEWRGQKGRASDDETFIFKQWIPARNCSRYVKYLSRFVYKDSRDHDDVTRAAQGYLSAAIEQMLFASVTPRMKFQPGQNFQLAMTLGNLQDVLWFQFAQAILGDRNFRDCEVCGRPFEIGPGIGNRQKVYCGSKCKMQAHRERVDKVRKLKARGMTVAQIAKATGLGRDQVKRYLANG